MNNSIVSSLSPVTLLGGADIGTGELNISLKLAPLIVAADGGADHASADGLDVAAVIGDLDSLSDQARSAYASVLHRVDELDTTDFEKVLMRVAAPLYLACGFLGGRLDHTLSVLNVMARNADKRVIFLSADDVAFLAPAHLEISVPRGTRIGLMPLGSVTVTSTGLRWDLAGATLHPAGMVSSSNETASDKVKITSDGPLIITLPLSQVAPAIAAVHAV